MLKENKAKSAHAEPTKWFDRAPRLPSYPSKRHNYKRGKSSMITMQNLHGIYKAEATKWFDRAPRLTSYPSKRHNYKRGKSPMITIDNMHQGCIFWVCSVVLLVVQCYRFCWCCSFCLLAWYTFLRVRGQDAEYVHAVLCCCSCPLCACKGGWG